MDSKMMRKEKKREEQAAAVAKIIMLTKALKLEDDEEMADSENKAPCSEENSAPEGTGETPLPTNKQGVRVGNTERRKRKVQFSVIWDLDSSSSEEKDEEVDEYKNFVSKCRRASIFRRYQNKLQRAPDKGKNGECSSSVNWYEPVEGVSAPSEYEGPTSSPAEGPICFVNRPVKLARNDTTLLSFPEEEAENLGQHGNHFGSVGQSGLSPVKKSGSVRRHGASRNRISYGRRNAARKSKSEATNNIFC